MTERLLIARLTMSFRDSVPDISAVRGVSEMGSTVTIRRTEARNRRGRKRRCDRTLDIEIRRPHVTADRDGILTQQIIDVPVSGRTLAGGEFVMSVDAAETPSAECTTGVRVPARRETCLPERSDIDHEFPFQLEDERVGAAAHSFVCVTEGVFLRDRTIAWAADRTRRPVILLTPPVASGSMKESLMDILCCPLDKSELELEVIHEDDEEILEGRLVCTECGEKYPIEDGIPNLLPPDMRDEAAA